jgi:AhpD family alkylhydroperoxidase
MSRLVIQSIETAPQKSAERLEAAKKASGFVPNLLGVLANSPEAIETYQTVGKINGRNSLSAAEREVVQITAAVTNKCGFCVAGHTKIAQKALNMDGPLVEALRQVDTLPDEKLNALATFTLQVMSQKGQVADDELDAFFCRRLHPAKRAGCGTWRKPGNPVQLC